MTVTAPRRDAAPLGLKADIARDFGRARATYDSASRLQRRTGDGLLERLAGQPSESSPDRILDLGCGTGWFTRQLLSRFPCSQVTGVDLSAAMIRQASIESTASADSDRNLSWLVADAESLPLADQSVDVIFSNLMIQWCDDPAPVLRECRRLLKPGGRLVLSTLTDGTLWELKRAWAAADPEQDHVNRFESEAYWRAVLDATLAGAILETETMRLSYPSVRALAQELRQLGAEFKGARRRRTMTAPGRLREMYRQYPRSADGGVVASYLAARCLWQRPATQ